MAAAALILSIQTTYAQRFATLDGHSRVAKNLNWATTLLNGLVDQRPFESKIRSWALDQSAGL